MTKLKATISHRLLLSAETASLANETVGTAGVRFVAGIVEKDVRLLR